MGSRLVSVASRTGEAVHSWSHVHITNHVLQSVAGHDGPHLLALWHPDVLFVGGLLIAVIHKFDNIPDQNR